MKILDHITEAICDDPSLKETQIILLSRPGIFNTITHTLITGATVMVTPVETF